MKRLLVLLALLGALARPAGAEVIEIASAASAASTDTGEIQTSGETIVFQLCGGTAGNVFSGSISVLQGLKTGKLVETWNSGAITTQSGCNVATFAGGFGQAAISQIVITRSGGTYSAWIYKWPVK